MNFSRTANFVIARQLVACFATLLIGALVVASGCSQPNPTKTGAARKPLPQATAPGAEANKPASDKSQEVAQTAASDSPIESTLERAVEPPAQDADKPADTVTTPAAAVDKSPGASPNATAQQATGTPSAPWLDGPPRVPEVLLSASHAKLTKLKVGDKLPNAKLPDLKGEATELYSLFGEKWTLVCYWNSSSVAARQELIDLTLDVAVPFEKQGIKVVGIAVHESAETANAAMAKAEAHFPVLVDEQGTAFAEVGSERLPRTFLVDADGKILWFDLEYSRSTRREIRLALDYLLGTQ